MPLSLRRRKFGAIPAVNLLLSARPTRWSRCQNFRVMSNTVDILPTGIGRVLMPSGIPSHPKSSFKRFSRTHYACLKLLCMHHNNNILHTQIMAYEDTLKHVVHNDIFSPSMCPSEPKAIPHTGASATPTPCDPSNSSDLWMKRIYSCRVGGLSGCQGQRSFRSASADDRLYPLQSAYQKYDTILYV